MCVWWGGGGPTRSNINRVVTQPRRNDGKMDYSVSTKIKRNPTTRITHFPEH